MGENPVFVAQCKNDNERKTLGILLKTSQGGKLISPGSDSAVTQWRMLQD